MNWLLTAASEKSWGLLAEVIGKSKGLCGEMECSQPGQRYLLLRRQRYTLSNGLFLKIEHWLIHFLLCNWELKSPH